MAFKSLKQLVSQMTEVEIINGSHPTAQLDSKNGYFEFPVDKKDGPMFRGLIQDAPIMDFVHNGKASQGYALKTLIITPLVIAIGYRSDYESDELGDDGNPKEAFVVTRERVAGSSSVLRIFGISPQVGKVVGDEFKPMPFILTTHGTQTTEILKIIGYRKREKWNESDVCEASGYDYSLQSGLFFKEIVSNLSLVVDPSGSKIIPQYDWGIPLTFASEAVDVSKDKKSFIYKITKGWGSDELNYIASLRNQRPKSPIVPKNATPEQRAKIMAAYAKSLADYNESVFDQIESSELNRMLVGFGDMIDGFGADIETHKLSNVNYDLGMQERPQYNFLKPVAQLRLPAGCKPLTVLKTYGNDFEKAWESLASEAKINGQYSTDKVPVSTMMITQAVEPLSDVAKLQMQLA